MREISLSVPEKRFILKAAAESKVNYKIRETVGPKLAPKFEFCTY